MIDFKVYIEPIAKGRPKVTMQGGFTHAYTPKKTANYEEAIRRAFKSSAGKDFTPYAKEDGLTAQLQFGMPIPKSYSKKKRAMCINHQMAHSKKPDIDNLIKAVLDALNGLAFEDDSSITDITAYKFYAEEPFVRVKIGKWGEL